MTNRNIFLLLLFIPFMATKAHGQNLVQNWSAEMGDVGDAPLDWTAHGGAWVSGLAGPDYADTVEDGTHFFFAGDVAVDTLEQDVNVTSFAPSIDAGSQYFTFSGYVQCYTQGVGTSDQSRIITQCLDAGETTILHTFDSDTISSQGVWQNVRNIFIASGATRYIRIMLIATRRSGIANDGYFDAISLEAGNKTAISNVSALRPVLLYPNPVTDQLIIKNAAGSILQICDISGREVYTVIVHSDVETHNIGFLSNGLYLAKIQDMETKQFTTTEISKK